MTKSVTLKTLRPKLPKIIEEIDSKMDRFIITKRGRPVALMITKACLSHWIYCQIKA